MSAEAGTTPALTRKQAAWLTCRAKRCCYTAMVVPTGRDVWRIARALDAPPWSFLVYFRSPRPSRDAFQLDQSGPSYRLLLAKQASRHTKSPKPCIFLLRGRDGAHRCGLGDLRPRVCQTFPADLVAGVVCILPETGCTCRVWNLSDLEIAEERALLEARQREAEEYCAVVAAWNQRVAAAPAGAGVDFLDYCRYLLDAYDRLAGGGSAEAP